MSSEGVVKIVPIDSVVEDPENYNHHPEFQIQQLMDSLSEWGQTKNIIVSPYNGEVEGIDYVTIAGNGTLRAMKKLGIKEVAVKIYDIDRAEQLRLMIADNHTGYMSVVDDAMLIEAFDVIGDNDLELIEIPGVTQVIIDELVGFDDGIEAPADVGRADEKENKSKICPHCGKEI